MKKRHVIVIIVFIILTIGITTTWTLLQQSNLNKYYLTEQKIADYQEELKDLLFEPSEELMKEMTDSYKVSAQKEYEELKNNQIPFTTILLISVGVSAVVCVIVEVSIFYINKRKKQ